MLSHAVRLDLLRAQRDVAARSQVILQRRVDLLQTAVNARQETEEVQTRQAALAAGAEAIGKHPVIRSLAEDNAFFVETLPKGAGDVQEARAELEVIRSKTSSIEQRLARSRQHVEIGGLSPITG